LATYVEMGLGRRAGLVCGWAYVVAMTFGVASSAPSSAYYADLAIHQMTGEPSSIWRAALLTTLVLGVAWWTAYRDIKLSTDVMLTVEAVSLVVMILIVGLAMYFAGSWVDRPQLLLENVTPSGFQSGVVLTFLTLAGFESVTTLGEEARQATTTIPRVILGCLVPMGLLYLVITYCLVLLSRQNGLALDQLEAPFDRLAQGIHLPFLGLLSSLGIAMSYFACALASLNAGSRVLYSMARSGQFWPGFAQTHPRNATPHRTIALIAIVALAVPVGLIFSRVSLSGCIDYLSQLAALGFIVAYFFVGLALPFYLRREKVLRAKDVAVTVGTLLVLGIVMMLSLYPVPEAPYRYLPYIFTGLVLLGITSSWWCRKRQ
jgi:amino acid transporter